MSTETDQNPTDAPAGWAGAELRITDPRSLTLDRNPRTVDDLERQHPELIASVATHGVLQPILADEDPEGAVHVRHGHCRTIAAVLAGLSEVPVIVTDAHADEHHSTRLIEQYTDNQVRQGFDAVDEGRVLEELSLFGLSASDIATSLATTTEAVESGLAVRRSQAARSTLSEHPELDLSEVAIFAEFEDDEEALTDLRVTLEEEPDQLAHEASRLRHEKARQQAVAEAAAGLRAAGVTVFENWRAAEEAGAWPLYRLAAGREDSTRLSDDPDAHTTCPGHAALLQPRWNGELHTEYYCTDPAGVGHIDLRFGPGAQPSGGQKTETEKAEMRRVRQRNSEWRAAQDVRRDFLKTVLAQKQPPKQTGQFLAAVLAAGDHEVTKALDRHDDRLACELTGMEHKPGRESPLATGLPRASAATAALRSLAVVLGAYEQAMDVHTWRNPSAGAKRYLTQLNTWGYALSTVERLATGEPDDTSRWPHLREEDESNSADAADATGTDEAGAVEVPGAVILDDDPDDDETLLDRDEPGGFAATVPVCRDEALHTVASAGWSVTTVHLPGDEPDAPAVAGEDPVTHLDEDDAEELDDGWFADEANTEDGGQAAGSEVV
jgi:ParB family chromosome partitioning protein